MSRRYLLLLSAIVGIAIVLSVIGVPKTAPRPEATRAAAAPEVDLTLAIREGEIRPALVAVPKGSRVRLRVQHLGARPLRLALAGYEDRLSVPTLAPGAVWKGDFLADRPGEDFAWLLDGQPTARLAVTGSHLVEGHR